MNKAEITIVITCISIFLGCMVYVVDYLVGIF